MKKVVECHDLCGAQPERDSLDYVNTHSYGRYPQRLRNMGKRIVVPGRFCGWADSMSGSKHKAHHRVKKEEKKEFPLSLLVAGPLVEKKKKIKDSCR